MRGHERIIDMRRAGMRPAIVFLNDYPCKTDWPQHGDHATVCVAGDQPEWLDLRYLVGMRVSVSASTEARGRRFLTACQKAGANTVAACAQVPGGDPWGRDAWVEIWHKEQANG